MSRYDDLFSRPVNIKPYETKVKPYICPYCWDAFDNDVPAVFKVHLERCTAETAGKADKPLS